MSILSRFWEKSLQWILASKAILLVLIIAAVLRLYKIADYLTFLGDEGRDALVVYNILHGKLTLLGPTASVGGFFLGPVYYYFMSPFLWLFNYNPVGPAVMVALLGVATVYLVYVVGKSFFDFKTGLVAAFLYAISPLVIIYSRSSWNPNVVPFFSILTIYVLYQAYARKSYKLFIVSGFLLGIMLQLHYLALFLGVIVAIYILIIYLRPKKLLKSFIAILKTYGFLFIGFLIGFSPFLAFEIRHDFTNIRNVFNFVLQSGDTGTTSNFANTVYDVFFRLFGHLILVQSKSPEFLSFVPHIQNAWGIIIFSFAVLSVFFLIRKLMTPKLGKVEREKYLLIFIWLFFGILLFGFYKKSIYDYYFGFMFPLPFILVGNIFSRLFSSAHKLMIVIGGILLFLLVGLNLYYLPIRQEGNRQLKQAEIISDFVLSKTDNKPFNFALITGSNSDHAYKYFFKLRGQDPITIENPQADPERNTVTDQLLVVCESLPCGPLGYSLWEVAGFGRAEIAGHWNVSVVEVYRLIHYKDE